MIPIVMICDDNYVMQTSVAITSLMNNKNNETVYEVNVVMAACSSESEKILKSMERPDCKINIVRESLDKYSDIKQMAHVSAACLLKFDICEIFDKYDKILYLDGDIIVRKDLSDLYVTDLGDHYAAAVKEMYGMTEEGKKDAGNINAGIMLFNASKMRADKMRDFLVDKRRSLGDRGSMDQQTYNMVFKGQFKYIPLKYNCVPGRLIGDVKLDYTMKALNDFYGTDYISPEAIIEDAVIIHFATGNKPWKYTFAPCAKEWYSYYTKSPFKNNKIKMYGIWGYRINNVSKILKNEGFGGVIKYISHRSDRKVKKKVNWD